MKLKVCGMKYKNNIEGVAQLPPDYMGFIFYEPSSRNFKGDLPLLPKSIKKVGVFVNETLQVITEKIATYNLDAVQLHGNETPELCGSIQDVTVIKVFSINDHFNFNALTPYENVCDYYLFDTKGKLPGGNGYTFNWNVLRAYPTTKPYFLSGGIGLDTLEHIKTFLKTKAGQYCYAIDVNSRFETEPGQKIINDIKQFRNELPH